MFFQLLLNLFVVMHTEIIYDEQHLFIGVLYESSHKIDKTPLGHVSFIAHKTAGSFIIDDRDHIDFSTFEKDGTVGVTPLGENSRT